MASEFEFAGISELWALSHAGVPTVFCDRHRAIPAKRRWLTGVLASARTPCRWTSATAADVAIRGVCPRIVQKSIVAESWKVRGAPRAKLDNSGMPQ